MAQPAKSSSSIPSVSLLLFLYFSLPPSPCPLLQPLKISPYCHHEWCAEKWLHVASGDKLLGWVLCPSPLPPLLLLLADTHKWSQPHLRGPGGPRNRLSFY